jgi:hypothetical protein
MRIELSGETEVNEANGENGENEVNGATETTEVAVRAEAIAVKVNSGKKSR